MFPARPQRRSVALLAALGLAVSACGTSTDESAATPDATAAETTAAETTAADTTTPDTTAAETTGAGADETEASDAVGPPADAATTLANYPAVDVIDLGTGATVNFAEAVAGGSLPTLIWFWAPH